MAVAPDDKVMAAGSINLMYPFAGKVVYTVYVKVYDVSCLFVVPVLDATKLLEGIVMGAGVKVRV